MRAFLVWVPGYHSFPKWAIIGINKIVHYTEDFVIESGSLYRGSTVLSNLLPRAILNFFTKNEAWVLRNLENKIKSNYLTLDSFIICLFAEKLLEISPRSRPRAFYVMSSHRSIPQIIRKPIDCACFWSYIRQILFFPAILENSVLSRIRLASNNLSFKNKGGGEGVTSCWETKTYFQRKGPTRWEGVTNWFRPTTWDFKPS